MNKAIMKGNELVGYTDKPLERITYDPELDFITVNAVPIVKQENPVVFFDDPEAAVKMYRSGATIRQVAVAYGMSETTAAKRLRALGVKIRDKNDRPNGRPAKRYQVRWQSW